MPISNRVLAIPLASIIVSSFGCQSSFDRVKSPTLALTATKAPSTPPPFLEQANQYARDGLYREAVAAFRKHLSEHAKDAAAHRTLGIVYVKTGAYKLALQHLQEALPSYPENFELNYYIAEAYRTQNRYADAIFHYNKALAAEPKNIGAMKALAWSYYSIRYYSEALKLAKELKKIDSNDFQISIINARILNKIGLNDKALAILDRTETLSSPDELPFLNSVKGDIQLDLGHMNDAEQSYRKALQDQPLLPGALTGLAKCFILQQQSMDLAVTYLERALRIRPNLTEAFYLLAQAYEKKDPKKSLDTYRSFIKAAGMDPQFQQELLLSKSKLAAASKAEKDLEGDRASRFDELEDQL
ncbi:MAG: tetratricopeptide repeat protein [Proteobacteria bacterium]|nr:tetratricopeptide repeat protein [Pseudomonadota bacterium]